jgi:hypothetical protein
VFRCSCRCVSQFQSHGLVAVFLRFGFFAMERPGEWSFKFKHWITTFSVPPLGSILRLTQVRLPYGTSVCRENATLKSLLSVELCDPLWRKVSKVVVKITVEITETDRNHHQKVMLSIYCLYFIFYIVGRLFYHILTAHSPFWSIPDCKTYFKLQKPTLTNGSVTPPRSTLV